jgi:hypothetical protein
MALGVPFTAAVTARLFRRARMTYADQALGLALTLVVALAVPGWKTGLVNAWMVAAAVYFGWTCTRFFRMRAVRAVPLGALGMAVGLVLYLLAVSFVMGVGVGFLSVARG